MNKGTCQVCGKPSGRYPICMECNKLKDEGKVHKCSDCGLWKHTSEECKCKDTSNQDNSSTSTTNKCIICGADCKYTLCLDCYRDKEKEKKNLPQNRTPNDIKQHYYKLKTVLLDTSNSNYTKNSLIRLVSIAEDLDETHKDDYLKKRLRKDISYILKHINDIESESTQEEQTTDNTSNPNKRHKFDDLDYRKQWIAEYQCDETLHSF